MNYSWTTFIGVAVVVLALVLIGRLVLVRRRIVDERTVGIGTVCTVDDDQPQSTDGERQILIQVTSAHGGTFIGRLIHHDRDLDLSMLRPGLVVLVAFNPASRDQLSLPDDILAVRASCFKPE